HAVWRQLPHGSIVVRRQGNFRRDRTNGCSCPRKPEPALTPRSKTMRKTLMTMTLASLVGATLPAMSTPAIAQAAQPARYSVADTPVGKLIDDPAAAAILKKHIPTVWANDMFQSAGRDL